MPTGKPIWDILGNCNKGTTPKTLFVRINTKRVNKNGTNRMNSGPITSLPNPLRTNVQIDSPANWSLEGTTAALRADKLKKVPATITDKKTSRTGLVNKMLSPKIG